MRSLALHLGLLCCAITGSLGCAEILARLSFTPLAHSSNTVADSILGWDSVPRISTPSVQDNAPVYFIGDSFTQGTSWPEQTQKLLQEDTIFITPYNLGVAGYGTVQEFLKRQRHFPEHTPKIVILQFFAWNDMRDNVGTPAIFYSPHTMQRPYLVQATEKEWILRKPFSPLLSSLLSRSSLYVHSILPHLMARDTEHPTYLSYTEKRAWDPFYRAESQGDPYVTSAYAVTKEALLQMKSYLEERGSILIVLGLDAAFTVDADVLRSHVPDPSSFDVSLPLTRVQGICKKLDIPFVNALPALRKEAQLLGKKIYNGPEGNLSGHLEPEGNDVLARLAAEAIRTYLQGP